MRYRSFCVKGWPSLTLKGRVQREIRNTYYLLYLPYVLSAGKYIYNKHTFRIRNCLVITSDGREINRKGFWCHLSYASSTGNSAMKAR